jgi:hemerythrin-like domain-containing protein
MFDKLASEMAHVHNMLIRGLNSIYLQASHIKPADEKPFCKYIMGWYDLLHTHHSGEEAMFFPIVEKMTGIKGIMDTNIDQHKAFHDGVDGLKGYVQAVIADQERYSGTKVVSLVDGFGTSLVQHLADEIPTILSLRQYGEERMAGLPKEFDAEGDKAMVGSLLHPNLHPSQYANVLPE